MKNSDELYVISNAFSFCDCNINVFESIKEAEEAATEANKKELNKYKVILLSEHLENIYERPIYSD